MRVRNCNLDTRHPTVRRIYATCISVSPVQLVGLSKRGHVTANVPCKKINTSFSAGVVVIAEG